MTTKNKFRFWNPPGKAFVEQYRYNGLVDELFDQDDMLLPSQYTGMKDNHQKEIWDCLYGSTHFRSDSGISSKGIFN